MERFGSHENCDFCPSRVVCHCLGVTEEQIVSAITNHDLKTIHDICRQTQAGDGCTCCHEDLREIVGRYSLTLVEI